MYVFPLNKSVIGGLRVAVKSSPCRKPNDVPYPCDAPPPTANGNPDIRNWPAPALPMEFQPMKIPNDSTLPIFRYAANKKLTVYALPTLSPMLGVNVPSS